MNVKAVQIYSASLVTAVPALKSAVWDCERLSSSCAANSLTFLSFYTLRIKSRALQLTQRVQITLFASKWKLNKKKKIHLCRFLIGFIKV